MRRSSFVIRCLLLLLLTSCSATKYVPDGQYLLDDVTIKTDNADVKPSSLSLYLRQTPNARWFSLFRTGLYIYDWSGRDSTSRINQALRRLGDAPVIYSPSEDERTMQELTKAVRNMGYLGAEVSSTTKTNGKKLKLTYSVRTGRPYVVDRIQRTTSDSLAYSYVEADSASSLLQPGMRMDVNQINSERQRITDLLRRNGYYRFNKDYITYTADTVRNTFRVGLTQQLNRPQTPDTTAHKQYYIGTVNFITDYDVLQTSALSSIEINDSIHYHGFPIYYKDRLTLRPKVLTDNLHFAPGQLYDESAVQRTYADFGRLGALKYTNIRFFETQRGDSSLLNAYVMLTRNKSKAVSFQIEGTNSAGDLGAAASVSLTHRNLFKGSETLTLKLRGAYEAVSGLSGDYRDEDYTELNAELTLNFPRFLFPFVSSDFRRRIRASTEFGLQYSYQFRPEFTRIVASANWSYKWNVQNRRLQHTIDLIDVSYLYMPWISSDFQEQYLEQEENYILKYNYEDRLIVRSGYSMVYSRGGSQTRQATWGSGTTLRFNLESAGNLLYLIGKATHMRKNSDGEYELLNIPFAQYVRFDVDYARTWVIDNRNSLSVHAGGGVVVPYGNADVVPLEKRYYSGGANSVRGWSVRDLGPGTFPGDGNYLNRTGDVKLDANIELRTRLFGKLQGAVFVDAGNIWTLRNYEDQPGGQFRPNKFLKQIAVGYGLGLRFDLEFFIIRLDGGMKAINPESGAKRYPLTSPRLSRDFAFHLAVGYPF